MAKFDVAAARKEGFSDSEIAESLASKRGFDLKAARDEGYSDAEIVDQLAEAPNGSERGLYDPKTGIGYGPRYTQPKSSDPRVVAPPTPFEGYDPTAMADKEAREGTNQTTNLNSDESWQGTAGRGFLRSLLPMGGAYAGGVTGAGIGAMFGPLAPVSVPVGGITGAILGGLGTSMGQEEILKQNPDLAYVLGQNKEQRATDYEKHPLMALASEYGPGFLTARPSFLPAEITKDAGALTRLFSNPAVAIPSLAATGGALETLRESTSGEKIDPAKVGIAATMTAAQRKPWIAGAPIAKATVTPLEEAILKSKGVKTNDAAQIAADLRASGVEPRPYDVLSEGAVANVHKGMSISPKAGELGKKYAVDVQEGTPQVSQGVVAKLAPNDPRTAEQAAEQAAKDIAEHPDVVAAKPDVVSGEAGSKIHEKFNADLDAREAEMSKTYKEAESGGKTVISPTAATPADLSKRMKEAFEPHTEIFGDIDIPASSRRFNSISKFLSDAKELDVGQVFKIRAQLNSVIGGKPGSPDARAAKDMKKALDDFMDEVVSKPDSLVGDADTASKWRSAIEQRREIGKLYGANDVFQDITEREWSGGKKIPKMSVFNAGERLLGNMSGARGQVQDLINLRDRLGANSPEWIALQKEGLAKVLGKDFGTKKFGTALAKFEADKPELAKLFITPEDRVRLTAGQDVVQGAVSRTDAQKVGTGIIGTNATDFGNSVSNMTRAELRDARVAGRQRFRDMMNRPKQSANMLEEIATGSDTQANIRSLFDSDEAEQIIRSAKALSKRFEKSEQLRVPPPEPSGSEDNRAIGALVVGATGGKAMPAIEGAKFLTKLLGDKKAAETMVTEALDPTKTDAVIARLEKTYGRSASRNFLSLLGGKVAKREATVRNASRLVGVGLSDASIKDASDEKKSEEKAKSAEEPQASLSQDYNVPWMARIIRGHEGLGDNPKSSAVGPFQFIDSTLASMYNKEHPNDTPITDKEAAAMRADGRISRDDMERYGEKFTEDNVQRVLDAGFPVTVGNVYLMHFAGEGAGPKVLAALKKDPNTPIRGIMSDKAIADNKGVEFNGKPIADFTVQDISDWAEDSMGASYNKLLESGELEG